MKPKKIKITRLGRSKLKKGKIYPVERWNDYINSPIVHDEDMGNVTVTIAEWEPVSDFKHGDPVWAWDDDKGCKCVSVYVGVHPMNGNAHVIYVPNKGITVFTHVEHRKPTITLKELAEKADIDLNEYELITENND